MKKLIIEIDEQCYEDVINDPEWDTLSDVLSFAIYFKEILKEGKPLQAELEKIKEEMDEYKEFQDGHFIDASEMKYALMYIIDTHLSELKGENNE